MALQRILKLSQEQLAELQHQRIHHEHPRVRQRMDAVWLRAHGMTQLRVAEMLGITRYTIAGYENLYEAGGIEALKDCHWGSRVSPLVPYSKIRLIKKKKFHAAMFISSLTEAFNNAGNAIVS